jgi:hypothetical protein
MRIRADTWEKRTNGYDERNRNPPKSFIIYLLFFQNDLGRSYSEKRVDPSRYIELQPQPARYKGIVLYFDLVSVSCFLKYLKLLEPSEYPRGAIFSVYSS